jgi:G3E family GTPase
VAVVVNEIGEIGIDGREIEATDVERMVELTSGCVCCQINVRFAAAVNEILDTVKPDLIVIETTGVADPGNLVREVGNVGLMLDAIVTVVDAENLDEHLAAAGVTERQIRAADYLVLNKTDLVDEAGLARARKRLAKLNRRAPVFETVRGALPHSVPFGSSARTYRDRIEGGEHLEEDGIEAFSWEGDLALDRGRFERLLGKLPRTVYRAKGIVRLDGASWPSLFSFASGRYELRFLKLPPGPFRNRGVFIGREVGRQRGRIEKGLARCEVAGSPAGAGLATTSGRGEKP